MSDSDDDVPLALRNVEEKRKNPASQSAAASKPVIADDDSSDEDLPIAVKHSNKKIAEATKPKFDKPKPVTKPVPAAAPNNKDVSKKPEKIKPKPEPKKKPASSSAATTDRVKKVFDMPGQTRDTPPEDDSLRQFYTSLLRQRPESEMARKWCAQVGLLSREEAEEWVAEQAKKRGSKSPAKSATGAKRAVAAGAGKKRLCNSDDFKSTEKKLKKPSSTKENKIAKKKVVYASDKDNDSDDDREVLPKKKERPPPSSAKRDVAFLDGGLDGSDSDDDLPLLQRVKV